jgi:pyridoxine 5'-phosphate synthase PdxJ
LHTGFYANAKTNAAIEKPHDLRMHATRGGGWIVHVGHGLTYRNIAGRRD